jgi:hypothetical protein
MKKNLPIILIILLIGVIIVFFIINGLPKPIDTEKQAASGDIILNTPQPGETISSPLQIEGSARGNWFFEASFPIVLTNWDGMIIGEALAQAQSDWMTEDFVPFTATLEFEVPQENKNGSLILRKDNPSGLPENEAAYEITIQFE